jgi:hypothetical protein
MVMTMQSLQDALSVPPPLFPSLVVFSNGYFFSPFFFFFFLFKDDYFEEPDHDWARFLFEAVQEDCASLNDAKTQPLAHRLHEAKQPEVNGFFNFLNEHADLKDNVSLSYLLIHEFFTGII